MTATVTVIDTGVANTASIAAAFARIGVEAVPTREADVVRGAGAVVLPGVGAFGAGMALLRETGMDAAVVERVERDEPVFAVCLGLQMLGEASEETVGERGLGVVSCSARAFGEGVISPHFGWNRVWSEGGGFEEGYAYFANSYRFVDGPAGWDVAWCEHGGRFVAAMRRGAVLACQFHPELSGAWGARLMGGWVERSGVAAC